MQKGGALTPPLCVMHIRLRKTGDSGLVSPASPQQEADDYRDDDHAANDAANECPVGASYDLFFDYRLLNGEAC